jgi:hypothetical protein
VDWVIQGERRFYLEKITTEDIADFLMTYFAVVSLFFMYRFLSLFRKERLIQKGKVHILLRFLGAGVIILTWETFIYFLYSAFYYGEPLTETSFFYNGVPMIILASGFLAAIFYLLYYRIPPVSILETRHSVQIPTEHLKELLVSKGDKRTMVPEQDFAYFFTKDKVVWLCTLSGSTFLINQTLTELEKALNPSTFFRVNRQLILSRKVIKGFEPERNQKLAINFVRYETIYSDDATVSKYNASEFKQWIYGKRENQPKHVAA